MKSFIVQSSLKLLTMSLLYPAVLFAAQKNIVLDCSGGIESIGGDSHAIGKSIESQLIPHSPRPTFSATAPEMTLKSRGSFHQARSDATLEILYQLKISQLWPVFLEDGTWVTSDVSIQLTLEMMVREIQKDGTIKILVGGEGRRIIGFDRDGNFDKVDNSIALKLLSPKIYQIAFDHPNNPLADKNFPNSYLDVEQNSHIKELLKNGTVNENDFVSAVVKCKFNY